MNKQWKTKRDNGKNKFSADIILKDYWRNKNRFADLMNYVLFQGEQVISSQKLKEIDTEESTAVFLKNETLATVSKTRDIIKMYEDEQGRLLLGIENQMQVHYAMPIRTMLYDALNYTRQCKNWEEIHRRYKNIHSAAEFLSGIRKDDKICPVVTVVIYYGENSWDGFNLISDLMEVPQRFQSFFQNYQINLLQANQIERSTFQNRDNRDFFGLLKEFYSDRTINLDFIVKKYGEITIGWETMAAIGAVTGRKELVDYAKSQKGEIHMCKALDNLREQGRMQGILEGKTEGITKTIEILRDLKLKDHDIINMIQVKFGISSEEVKNRM